MINSLYIGTIYLMEKSKELKTIDFGEYLFDKSINPHFLNSSIRYLLAKNKILCHLFKVVPVISFDVIDFSKRRLHVFLTKSYFCRLVALFSIYSVVFYNIPVASIANIFTTIGSKRFQLLYFFRWLVKRRDYWLRLDFKFSVIAKLPLFIKRNFVKVKCSHQNSQPFWLEYKEGHHEQNIQDDLE